MDSSLQFCKDSWCTEKLRRPMHIAVWSLISYRCSCLSRWFLSFWQLQCFSCSWNYFSFEALLTDNQAKLFEFTHYFKLLTIDFYLGWKIFIIVMSLIFFIGALISMPYESKSFYVHGFQRIDSYIFQCQ